jgi:hypothetical protein
VAPATLEVAHIFRQHGEAYRRAHPLPRHALRLMRAIEICRTSALGGHVEQCGHCGHRRIHYNSCRNRHCPKCGSPARARWLQQRRQELLPVPYFHVVFTIPAALNSLDYQNQRLLYDRLFRASMDSLLTIARDPRHLGGEPGFFGVLHTWGQNLEYHPHIHYLAAAGGLSPDGQRWVGCLPGFFLPVRVLSALFRNRLLGALEKLFDDGELRLSGELAPLAERAAFERLLAPLKVAGWVVYAKPPFGSPAQMLDYLGRYTNRVALSNDRLLSLEAGQVRFRWKDYRHQQRPRVMTLEAGEFIRRFLLHALPDGFQRIRFGGFLANCHRRGKLTLIRQLLANTATGLLPPPEETAPLLQLLAGPGALPCPACGRAVWLRIETLEPIRWRPEPVNSS